MTPKILLEEEEEFTFSSRILFGKNMNIQEF
jgi:hypothetical protein